jgi:hypothetical protein
MTGHYISVRSDKDCLVGNKWADTLRQCLMGRKEKFDIVMFGNSLGDSKQLIYFISIVGCIFKETLKMQTDVSDTGFVLQLAEEF